MYLKIGEEYADAELSNLEELLSLLDEKLRDILERIRRSPDPESDGLLDRGEYFIGVGFCATQQYLVDTLTFTGVDMSRALALGPVDLKGNPVALVLNAAANWWKHSAEWWSRGSIPPIASRTVNIVDTITDGNTEYALSNVLAGLLGSHDLSKATLVDLIPKLIVWRNEVALLSAQLKSDTSA